MCVAYTGPRGAALVSLPFTNGLLLAVGGLISADVHLSVCRPGVYIYILHFVCGGCCWTQKIYSRAHTRIILGLCPLFVLLHIDIMSIGTNTIAHHPNIKRNRIMTNLPQMLVQHSLIDTKLNDTITSQTRDMRFVCLTCFYVELPNYKFCFSLQF